MAAATSYSTDVAAPVQGRTVRVWDPLVRACHWLVAAAVVANGLLNDPEGAPHLWIGYGVIALLSVRILWGVIGTRPARFSAFPPSVSRARAHTAQIAARRPKPHLSHNPLGALMV